MDRDSYLALFSPTDIRSLDVPVRQYGGLEGIEKVPGADGSEKIVE
jgi:hypothetical protein